MDTVIFYRILCVSKEILNIGIIIMCAIRVPCFKLFIYWKTTKGLFVWLNENKVLMIINFLKSVVIIASLKKQTT